MIKINNKQQKLLLIFVENSSLSSSQVHALFVKSGEDFSLVTVKRELAQMASRSFLVASGKGRGSTYSISALGRIFTNIDANGYCSQEPDKRFGQERFNFDLLPALPSDIFTVDERLELDKATNEYNKRTADLPATIAKKELERLIIELSWKSSKIEGNTYTLLDTEKLILENKEAPGHDKKEAVMILNHKRAFDFVHKNSKEFRELTPANLEELHKILIKDLDVGEGLRAKPVGVVGSKYQPLDNIYQIKEAVNALAVAVAKMETPYAKALVALVGLSYIQPFEDGNKRISRLAANALLLAYNCAPLSYRSVDEKEYREAMLVFYELNSIVSIKKIFIGQYEFAAKNYAVK
ncbi:MAG: Fic family protein [bacterium]|nr:Fic family protein [bacterium]